MLSSKKMILLSLLLSALQVSHAASTINTPLVAMETWETHIDRLCNDEPQLEALYTKEASLYHEARQECLNVLSMLQQNVELVRAQLKVFEQARENGHRALTLFDAASKKAIAEQMQGIIDSANEKIALVTKEVEFLTTYRDELKLVYQGIMSQGVTRAATLEKGIERLEIVFDSALDAKKKFLDAVFSLVHEAEEMVTLVVKSDESTEKADVHLDAAA